MQQNNSARGPQGGVSDALSAVRAEASAMKAGVRFPGEDGGRSLAEMAQRDLDAALQLLADRAQYITGASGAAIALRRSGKNDMLCRASAGSNAPELGALLSTEFGLSGESVRTRQPLRCDDAARDARVNHEVCRQMGIASVVVMPVVHDDEVLGVFELFSGKANAFGARDVSAVQRLSEMVETAVRLAHATETLPERLQAQRISSKAGEAPKDQVLDGQDLKDIVLEEPGVEGRKASPATVASQNAVPAKEAAAAQKTSGVAAEGKATGSVPAGAQKKLFWSAALSPAADAAKPEPDQSHVPPVLRSLRKCEACGFPVSAGRTLCVECEEKKWRGQLKAGPAGAGAPGLPAAKKAIVPAGSALQPQASSAASVPASGTRPEAKAFAAAAQSVAASAPAGSTQVGAAKASDRGLPADEGKDSIKVQGQTLAVAPNDRLSEIVAENASPGFVLSAGLEPSPSWLASHKYMVGVLVAVAVAVGAFFLMR